MRDVSIGFQTRGPYIHSKRENKAIVLRCQLCSIVQLFWYESFLKFRSSIFVGFSSDFLIFVSVILCGNLFLTRPRQKKMTKMSSTPPSLNLIKQKFFMFFFSLPIFHELPECKCIRRLVFFQELQILKARMKEIWKKLWLLLLIFFLLWNVCWMREMKRFDVRVVPCFHPVLISLALGYFRFPPFLHHNFSLVAILFSLLLWLQLKLKFPHCLF